MRTLTLITAALTALITLSAHAIDLEKLTENLTPEQAARYEVFNNFYINGVCGENRLDLAQSFGINTIRGYTVNIKNGSTKRTLDEAHSRGMKVILSEWMPHHGENKDRNGTWNFDYTKNVEQRLANFAEKVAALGDHPAVLMWGLGNEVHLDREYLEYVNKMSRLIHDRFPLALTSLTMINAKPENIEKIKRYAPDLDIIGVQSYSVGAVRGGIRNMEEHWGKPYYYSEFNGKGPWNFGKTEWGTPREDLPAQRVADIHACYDAIEAAPRCLGSTAFLWGQWSGADRSTYFSLLLSAHPHTPKAAQAAGLSEELLITPAAEVLAERFAGKVPLENRAPVITKLEALDGQREVSATPNQRLRIRLEGEDTNNDRLTGQVWVVKRSGNNRVAAGPFRMNPRGITPIQAPAEGSDDYLIVATIFDGNGACSSTTIPMQVKSN